MPREPILGAVLAGGRSRRFGSDKADAVLGRKRLIQHAIASLQAHADTTIVCGRSVSGVRSIPDRPEAGLGPLGGLNAALHHAAAHGFAGVLTLGCDMPILPADLAGELIGPTAAIVLGQHLIGYWPSTLAAELDTHLATSEDRSILEWLGRVRPRSIVASGAPLPNINTPADLKALQADWPDR